MFGRVRARLNFLFSCCASFLPLVVFFVLTSSCICRPHSHTRDYPQFLISNLCEMVHEHRSRDIEPKHYSRCSGMYIKGLSFFSFFFLITSSLFISLFLRFDFNSFISFSFSFILLDFSRNFAVWCCCAHFFSLSFFFFFFCFVKEKKMCNLQLVSSHTAHNANDICGCSRGHK